MRWLLLAALLSACSDARPTAGDPGVDAAPAPLYAGPITLPVRTTLDWVGAANEEPVTAAHFVDGRGTIAFAGVTVPAVVYHKIDFAPYTLAAIAATTDDGLVIAYAYCQDGKVTAIYSETLAQSATPQTMLASPGTCTFTEGGTTGEVAFQRPVALAFGPVEDVADVDGADLRVRGGTGTLRVDGVDHQLTVFTAVDCAACGGAGWQEQHVTLQRDGSLAFAILYLRADKPATVQLAYGIRFDRPSLWPPDAVYDATWTLKK